MAHPEQSGEEAARSSRGLLACLLVLFALLGLCAASALGGYFLLAGKISDRMLRARQTKARADISNIASAVDFFKIDTGRFPDSLEDLITAPAEAVNWEGPYLKEAGNLVDPWGNDYEYILDGSDHTITSYGADGVEGGEGEDADITNHDQGIRQPR